MKTKQLIRLKDTPSWNIIPDQIKHLKDLDGYELALELSRGYWCLIDPENIWLTDFCWYAGPGHTDGDRRAYAVRAFKENGKRHSQFMHQLIVQSPDQTDHKDQHILAPYKILDNRRSNLRSVTSSKNCANKRKPINGSSSRYKGVNWHVGKWRAVFMINGVRLYLGRFDSQEAAALAYNAAHALHHPDIPEGRNQL